MTDFPSYTLGTVSVSNGDVAIVGDGTIWTGVNARAGDTIVIGTSVATIVDVTDDTHLKIDAWPFASVVAGTTYKIIQNSPLRFVGGQAMADVSSLIAVLRDKGLLWYLPAGYTDPNSVTPALTADDGQGILKIDTGALWVMQGGAWVAAGTFKGISFKGAYIAATAYAVNDVVTNDGSAYIVTAPTTGNAPPNATYYSLLASKGDAATIAVGTVTTGAGGSAAAVSNSGTSGAAIFNFTIPQGNGYGGTSTTSLAIGAGSKTFTTQSGLAYANGARVRASSAANTANWMEGLVTYSGTTLTMTADKTSGSGTYADWNFNVVGQPGAGDLSSSNNLSELTSTPTALTNLGGTTVGKALFTAADAGTAMVAIGGIDATNVVSVTSTTTLTSTAFGKFHVISGTTANYTITLPTPVGNAGKSFWVQVAGPSAATKLYTLSTPAGTIDGSSTRIMWSSESALLWSDGTNWFKLMGRTIPFSGNLKRTTDQSFTSGGVWAEVAFTSASDDLSGLNLCWDTSNNRFLAPRPSGWNFNFNVAILQSGTPTYAQGKIEDASATLIAPVQNLTGNANSASVAVAAKGSGAQAFKAFVRGDGTSPKVSAVSQGAILAYTEIPTW